MNRYLFAAITFAALLFTFLAEASACEEVDADSRVQARCESDLCVTKNARLLEQPGLTTCSFEENEMADESVAVEYRAIQGFEDYRVGNDGSVWSFKSGHWEQLKPTVGSRGYLVVTFRGPQRKQFYVHNLVLEAFVGPRPEGYVARHFPNRDRLCCHLSNLQWGTYQENSDDMVVHGTKIQGAGIPWTTLSDELVLEIRQEYASNKTTVRDIAAKYGVAFGTMTKLLRHVTWKHVGGPHVSDRISRDSSKPNRGKRRFIERSQKESRCA